MTDSHVLRLVPDRGDERWWIGSPIAVRWQVERQPDSPLVTGTGTIQVLREDLDDDDADEFQDIGKIVVTKVPLGDYDANDQMDALSLDHDALATDVLDGGDYDGEFHDWLTTAFDVVLVNDPIFVLDLTIEEPYRDADGTIAAHAVLDALVIFGGWQSPVITFHREDVRPDLRDSLDRSGYWAWVHALRAKQWKHVFVAMCQR